MAIAACLVVTMFTSCKKDTPDLNGTVTISPTANVYIGDELTAAYSGSEKVTWQWKKGETAINGATSAKYTPTEAGNYTVTASAAGYNSKTSAAVEVKAIQNLSGNVTITPNADVFTGDELAAAYSGTETVTWQWNKGGTAINGATSNKYKPTEAGSYTVTASAKGYNSKTSDAVVVKVISAILLEEIQRGSQRNVYEYDDQDRITKISQHNGGQLYKVETFRYDVGGHMEEYKEEYPLQPELNRIATYIKSGDKIIITRTSNGWSGYSEYELNAQGFPIKLTSVDENENGDWYNETETYTWQNENLTQIVVVDEREESGVESYYTYTVNITHDNYKSPSYHCKTPKWVLLNFERGNGLHNVNNIKTVTGAENATYTYTYNADGFPATRTRGTDTETFTYKKR